MGGYPGDPYSQQQPHARRAPSGLPLRKSQSAVELGSWRGGFGSGGGALDDAWDMSMGDEGHAVRLGGGRGKGRGGQGRARRDPMGCLPACSPALPCPPSQPPARPP